MCHVKVFWNYEAHSWNLSLFSKIRNFCGCLCIMSMEARMNLLIVSQEYSGHAQSWAKSPSMMEHRICGSKNYNFLITFQSGNQVLTRGFIIIAKGSKWHTINILSYWCFCISPSVLFFQAKFNASTLILLRDMLGKTSWYSIDVSGNDRCILLYLQEMLILLHASFCQSREEWTGLVILVISKKL